MTEEHSPDVTPDEAHAAPRRIAPGVVVALVVVALFAGVWFAKARATGGDPAGGAQPAARTANSITGVRNDALADYQAARKTGKPIYILFHSLS